MECKKCGKSMRLDDVDFNFEGNKDNYLICDACNIGAIEKIRNGKSVEITWSDDDLGDE